MQPENYANAYKKLNSAQKKAVDFIDGPVLVVAGPGTGKTQLLALRAANILQKTDTAPQNILCLTYTEVGVRNMQERIASFIGKEAYDIRISTYHGFGSEIIRSHKEFFDDYGESQPVDKIGQYQIMEDIYSNISTANILWRKDVYLKDAIAAISEVKRANLSSDDIRQIAKNNLDFIETASMLTSTHLAGFTRISKTSISLFQKLFIKLQDSAKIAELPKNVISLEQLAITTLAESLLAAEETGKTNTITSWKNKWLTKDNKDNWVLTGKREVKKMFGLADIFDSYQAQLKNRQLFDYDDMILQAINGISASDELRFTLQEKFQYIMLDEFQDTNKSQLDLIELLTNNPSSEGRPNILAVGDDDQAIYGFQGAMLGNMLRYAGMYKNVENVTLTENWRSHKDILNLSDAISSQIEDRLHKKLGFDSKTLVAKNPKILSSNIKRLNFKSDVSELAWVAKQVAKLIKQGTKPSEIAVLAPKHKYLEPLVAYLSKQQVPVRYDKRENVLEDKHIVDLTNMARLVEAIAGNDQKTTNTFWPAVLSADQFALPTSEIWKISWLANKNSYNHEETSWQALMMDNEVLKPISLFFSKLALVANNETLETMLDYLVGIKPLAINEPNLAEYTSPYYEYYFGTTKQQAEPTSFLQTLSNLTVLRQHLRQYKQDSEEHLKLQDLIEFVNNYFNAREKLLNTSPYHSSAESVQLLTAYGAKGLEFECVFVLGVLDDVWGMKARGNYGNITWPQNLQMLKRTGQNKDEKVRLFYVAITRAKHTLYLTSHSQNFAGKETTLLEFLEEYDEEGGKESPHLPTANKKIEQASSSPPQLEAMDAFWHTKHLQALSQADLKEMIKPRLETFQLSATGLNHFTDLVHSGPTSFFINKILKFPQGPSVDGQYGNAIHETMEAVLNILKKDGEIPDTDQVIKLFTTKLKAKKLNRDDYARQAERGQADLSIFMPIWWPNFELTSQAEFDFRNEGCFVDDAHLSGKLDQLIIDHDEKILQVIDFKTGKPHSIWAKDIKLHKYRQQLLFYKILTEQSHTFKTYTAISGRLVFTAPNEYELVDELNLNYQDPKIIDEIKYTEKLIRAVWNRIMKLDFPDTSQFSNDIKGTLEFEDWLIAND